MLKHVVPRLFKPRCSPGVLSQALYLEVPALGLKPVIDETLRVSGKAQHELSLGLQLVDGFYGLMDLEGKKVVGPSSSYRQTRLTESTGCRSSYRPHLWPL